ncbi:MAG: enoyl-CoA hydratase/isomerase family protein [Chloroflexi bacterium]|nr:enoyl-CoA hydratase/isomerase family protein [Chloroflexota bacterium]
MALIYEKKGRIAWITLNRPEVLNAVDPETLNDLHQAWVDFRDDPQVWVAVLTGAGERAFCAGADLKKLIPIQGQPGYQEPPNITRGLEIWKPIIAAVNGLAMGGGLELALSCDLRLASEKAVFGAPEVTWSIMPGWGATQRLPRAIPYAKAAEMILMAHRMDAQEAYRLGLVNLVVPALELLPTAQRWAEEICELGPLGVRAAKEAMVRGLGMSLPEGLRLEELLFDTLRRTEDYVEGPRAFAEKRKPEFKAR